MRKIGHGRQFGFEEPVMCQAQRLFRAKVVGLGRANLLVLSKKHWLKLLDDDDVDAYLKLCKEYTDIMKDGQDLA